MIKESAISAMSVLSLGLLLLAPTVCVADSVTVGVGSYKAAAGGEVEIPINIKGTAGIGALELELTFNPEILEPKKVDKGAAAANAMLEFNPRESGRLRVVMVIMNGLPAEGIVATARMSVRGKDGNTTPLRLEKVQAWNFKTDQDYLVSTESGVFTVSGGWPWGWIAAVAAFLLILVMLKSRRKQAVKV